MQPARRIRAGDSGPSESSAATPLGRWADRHATLIDAIVVTALFLYDVMYLVSLHVGFGELSRPRFVLAVLLSATTCLLYVFRRRWPHAVAVAVFLGTWGYVALGVGVSPAPLVLMGLMLYFLGTRFPWRVVHPAALLVAVWVIVAAQPVLAKGYLRIGEVGVLVLTAFFVATVGLFTRARRRHVAELRVLNSQLARERDARAAVAAAEERARIAREMHDIVSHSLGTMVVMADGAARTAGTDAEQAGQAMERVRDTGREAMSEMRRMLDVLREDEGASRAPQPGLDALDRLLAETRTTGLRVDLRMTGAPVPLPTGVDLAAYRIVQEALTNARKHGGRLLSVVTVTLAYREDAIELHVVDDGVGTTTSSSPAGVGHGLVGMRERVTAYGGTLETGPGPHGGFAVHALLPVRAEEDDERARP